MSLRSTLLLLTLLGACGGKPEAPSPDTTAPSGTMPVPSPDAPSTSPDASAPTPPSTPSTPTTPSTPLPEVPPELAIPKVPNEVTARLLTGEDGCVGLSKSGRAVASIITVDGKKILRVTEHGPAERGYLELDGFPFTDPRSLPTDPDVATALSDLRLLPCQTTPVVEGHAVIPKDVPITIVSNSETLSAQIEGNRALTDFAQNVTGRWHAHAAYWSPDHVHLFLRVVRVPDHPADDLTASDYGVAFVNGLDLGQPECIPRPAEGKPLPTDIPPFDPAPASPDCVAMTPDGAMAAFKVFYVDRDDPTQSRPNTLEWHGQGIPPDIDLSCMARGCKAEDKARVTARAQELGLVGCHRVRGGLTVGEVLAPFMYQDNKLKLKTTTGWRTAHALADHVTGGGREAMWQMWQHPAGGPLFVYVGLEDTRVNTVSVRVLNDEDLGLCPPAPANTLPVTAKVSSAAKDYQGLKFGAAQLVDGDPTTSWQPADPKSAPWVELDLGGPKTVAALELWNGFQRKDGHGDLFVLNARAKTATLTFSDGTTETLTLDDTRGPKRFDFAPRQTTTLRLDITGLHPGTRWKDDLALSELRVLGP